MATAPTTVEAIRDRIIDVIDALVPGYEPGTGFRHYRNDGDADFEAWCETKSPAARRRFQVRDTGDDSPPIVTNGDAERREVTFRIMVAYPHTGRDGRDQALDRDDTMSLDQYQIEHAVGMWGRANFAAPYPDACWLSGGVERLIGEVCDYLIVTQTMTFVRTMS